MRVFHAHTVAPVDTPVITDGGVAVEGKTLKGCGSFEQLRHRFNRAEIVDLTDCVILPGLVNGHTHLELSHLKNKVPYRGDFVDWVRRLKGGRADARVETEHFLDSIIEKACQASLRNGVTTVGDICPGHRAWPRLSGRPIRKRCFAEVLGMCDDSAAQRRYLQECVKTTRTDELLRLGLSPHAPYSTGADMYQMTAEIAAENNLLVTTHLAENREEIEFVRTGAGPWRDYLEELGKWDGSFAGRQTGPVSYFLELDLGEQPFLLAHVNYIDDEELDALAKTSHGVVYCPRSHDFFGHPLHRFREMVQKGILVCLGTDSLASNDSLSILEEMRFIHRQNPDFPADTLLKMATIYGARALGWDDKIGTLTVGKEADFIAVPLTNPQVDPMIDLLESTMPVRETYVQGKAVSLENNL